MPTKTRRRSSSRSRSRSRRRNPTGTLLVNPKKGGKSRRVRRSSGKGVMGFLRKFVKNPLLANPRKRKHSKKHSKRRAHSKRRNPLLANPKHRRAHKRTSRRGRRRNPLLANPVLINRRRSKGKARRRNPSSSMSLPVVGGLQRGAQRLVGKLPLVGGILAGAIGTFGAALGGAIGVLPTAYVLPMVSKRVRIPEMLKPYAYTLVGSILSATISAFGGYVPLIGKYKAQIAIGVATAGGAVDAYRWKNGKSHDLGDVGDEMGDMGDIGDDGGPLAANEYADASLSDADYMGDGDFSADEIGAIELGRKEFARRFYPGRREDARSAEGGPSGHAGRPGRRLAWLIYWIGMDNVQAMAKLPENERRAAIEHMRREAKLRAHKLISQGAKPDVQEAETAGLLVAA